MTRFIIRYFFFSSHFLSRPHARLYPCVVFSSLALFLEFFFFKRTKDLSFPHHLSTLSECVQFCCKYSKWAQVLLFFYSVSTIFFLFPLFQTWTAFHKSLAIITQSYRLYSSLVKDLEFGLLPSDRPLCNIKPADEGLVKMSGTGNNDSGAAHEKKKPAPLMTSRYVPSAENQSSHLAPMKPLTMPSPLSPAFRSPGQQRPLMTPAGLPSSPAHGFQAAQAPPYLQPDPPSPAYSQSSFVPLNSLKQDEAHPLDLQPPRMGQSPYGNGNIPNGSTHSVYNYSTDWIPMQPPTPRNGGFGLSSTGLPITAADAEAETLALKKRKRLRMMVFCGIPAVAVLTALILGVIFGFMRYG
ncbi:hypothetical protein PspLS_07839 [Pyricularia sp. CBS 133598]|nr:hypothetical protein PspLS_07839 [Pyricularia sp. CBS 133598]